MHADHLARASEHQGQKLEGGPGSFVSCGVAKQFDCAGEHRVATKACVSQRESG